MCACWQIESKIHILSIVSMAHWQSVHILSGGARVQSQAKTLYLNLGSLHLKIKKQAVQNQRVIQKNKIPQNLNAPLNLNVPLICNQVPGTIIITACKYKVSYVCQRGIKHNICVSRLFYLLYINFQFHFLLHSYQNMCANFFLQNLNTHA